MDWTHVAAIIASNFALMGVSITLFLWSRSESKADHRALESWVKDMLASIQAEIKDFHGRLCAIEERNRGDK